MRMKKEGKREKKNRKTRGKNGLIWRPHLLRREKTDFELPLAKKKKTDFAPHLTCEEEKKTRFCYPTCKEETKLDFAPLPAKKEKTDCARPPTKKKKT